MVAENGLGAELVSGCGVVIAWTEDLHPWFVWVLNMLVCIIHGAPDDEIKHFEHPHKSRMQILSPCDNNSTSRDKFSAQAIFSYHAT